MANIETATERDARRCRTYCAHNYSPWSEAHTCDSHEHEEHGWWVRCSRSSGRDNCEPDVGDVWRCEHGAIFYAADDGRDSLMSGWYIARLHPFWDRKRYRAAVAALEGGGE